MRTLRRARERHHRTSDRLRRRVVAAGAAAAISLAPQTGLADSPKTSICDKHQLAVSRDADSDLLADREELALGYEPFGADQNRNGIADGAELAMRCAQVLAQLPSESQVADKRQPYKQEMLVFGLETCDVCGEAINMGVVRVVNPALGLTVELPLIGAHYMEHGSFRYAGQTNSGRVAVARLTRALGVRFPCEPDPHRFALAWTTESLGQIAPDANDLDGDLLADSEELAAGLNLYDADQDHNLVPDGVQLAQRCAEIIDRLPTLDPNAPQEEDVYKISYMMRGLEWCEICGQSVNMGYWQIVDGASGVSMQVPEIARHFMEHGSFSFAGTVHGAQRADVAALLAILGLPTRCGDLGTVYSPGDLNHDCKVDARDLVELADGWLTTTEPAEQ